jgi:hypothetical protein
VVSADCPSKLVPVLDVCISKFLPISTAANCRKSYRRAGADVATMRIHGAYTPKLGIYTMVNVSRYAAEDRNAATQRVWRLDSTNVRALLRSPNSSSCSWSRAPSEGSSSNSRIAPKTFPVTRKDTRCPSEALKIQQSGFPRRAVADTVLELVPFRKVIEPRLRAPAGAPLATMNDAAIANTVDTANLRFRSEKRWAIKHPTNRRGGRQCVC